MTRFSGIFTGRYVSIIVHHMLKDGMKITLNQKAMNFIFVTASNQTGLDTRSMTRTSIIVGI